VKRGPKITSPRPLVTAAILAAALAVSGCGGSTGASQGSGGGTPGSRAFIAQADPICKRFNQELAANKGGNHTMQEIARRTPPNVAIERRAIAELEKLAPPSELRQTWRRVLAYRRTLAAQLVTLTSAAKHNDTAKLKLVAEEKIVVHQKLLGSARSAGFKSCGEVG